VSGKPIAGESRKEGTLAGLGERTLMQSERTINGAAWPIRLVSYLHKEADRKGNLSKRGDNLYRGARGVYFLFYLGIISLYQGPMGRDTGIAFERPFC